MKPTIKVYGAVWCEDTERTRKQLNDLGVEHAYIDIDQDKAAERWITERNGGKRKTPTVDVGGTLLFEPGNEQLAEMLHKHGLI